MMSSEQPSTSIATNSSQNDPANAAVLIDLNDDCLLEIFDYLSLDDLAHILATCKQLNEIAQSIFLHKIRQHRIEVSSSCISAWHNGQNITCNHHHYQREPNFLNFFHYFGKCVTELLIQFDKQLTASRLKGCLVNNCSETLTKLTLSGIHVDHGFNVLTTKFPRVQELALYFVDGTKSDIESLLECFPSVTQLELVNCHKYNRIYIKVLNRETLLQNAFRPDIVKLFPRLERFKYGDDVSYFQTELVKSVMRRSPRLRCLSIGLTSHLPPGHDLNEITAFSPNLERLELWNMNSFCRDISKSLPRLKTFIVNGPLLRAFQFRTNPQHLEELVLGAQVMPNYIISNILRMETLKKLTLHISGRVTEGWLRQLNNQDLQKFANLPNLEELTIKQPSDSIDVDSIRRFILCCATLKRFTLVYFMKNKEKKEQFLLNDFGPSWKVFEDFMAVGIERQP